MQNKKSASNAVEETIKTRGGNEKGVNSLGHLRRVETGERKRPRVGAAGPAAGPLPGDAPIDLL